MCWICCSVYVIKRGGERRLEAREHVTVRAQRDLDGAVTEALHDCPRMGALGNEHRHIAVAKVVESGLLWEARLDYGWLEVSRIEIGVSEWPTP